MTREIKKNALIILLFAIIGCYAVFPVLGRFDTALYGTPTDPLAWLWDFWWLKHASLNGIASGFVPVLAVPFGVERTTLYPLWEPVIRQLALLLGHIAAYNFQVFLSFFLTGMAMFALSFYLTKSRPAAFFAGAAFTLSPYHFARAWNHLCLANVHWMVFYVLALFVVLRRRGYKPAIAAGIMLGLSGHFGNFYYFYFMIIFTVLLGIFLFFYNRSFKKENGGRKTAEILKGFALAAAVGTIIVLPQAARFIKQILFMPEEAKMIGLLRPFQMLFADSAVLLNYFLPTEYHPLFGRFTKVLVGTPLYGENSGAEQSLYLGIMPLALAFLGYKYRHGRQKSAGEKRVDPVITFFAAAVFIFMIFSFAPYLAVGRIIIPFPSFFLYNLFPMFRNYARFGVLVMLSVSVLAAFGLKELMCRIKAPGKKAVVYAGIFGFMFFEFLNVPPVTGLSKIPEVYQWLKSRPPEVIAAEYPLDMDERPLLFYQTVHQKRLINGAVPGTYAYLVRQKIIDLEAPHTAGVLAFLGADYVFVHKESYRSYAGGEVLGRVPELEHNPGFKLTARFAEVDVYEVRAQPVDPDTVPWEAVSAQKVTPEEPAVLNKMFAPGGLEFRYASGDELRYLVRYMRVIPALHVNVRVEPDEEASPGKNLYSLRADLYSHRFFSFFIDLRTEFHSLFSTEIFSPLRVREVTKLRNKKRTREAVFDYERMVMHAEGRTVAIAPNTQDPLSAVFFLSGHDFEKRKKLKVYVNPGKTNYVMELAVLGRERITVAAGTYSCRRLEGTVYKDKGKKEKFAVVNLWFADSGKKPLVLMKTRSKLGLIDLELSEQLIPYGGSSREIYP